MTVESFDEYVGRIIADLGAGDDDAISVDREWLRQIWNRLGDGDESSGGGMAAFEEIFLQCVSPNEEAGLAFRPGGWTIKVSEGLLKTGLVAALLSAILLSAGYSMLPGLVLPAVLPVLFDLEKVRISVSQAEVHAKLAAHEDVRLQAHTPDHLYYRLPQTIRNQVSKLDFLDLLEHLRLAGLADRRTDGAVILHKPESARFRITVI